VSLALKFSWKFKTN